MSIGLTVLTGLTASIGLTALTGLTVLTGLSALTGLVRSIGKIHLNSVMIMSFLLMRKMLLVVIVRLWIFSLCLSFVYPHVQLVLFFLP